jgi:hypothetical protein
MLHVIGEKGSAMTSPLRHILSSFTIDFRGAAAPAMVRALLVVVLIPSEEQGKQ